MDLNNKKYLVTGGAGFIGANFVKYLLRKYGDSVNIVIVDALTYAGNLSTLDNELRLPNVTFVKADICDAQAISQVFENHRPDYVVNFAAETHVDRSILDPGQFLRTNVMGTYTLLNAALVAWGDDTDKRFLQVSTDEVYGSLQRTCITPEPLPVSNALRSVIGDRSDVITFGDSLFTEETPLAPHSPYSASKASADMMAMAYHDTFRLPVVITRCSNNYGPYQFPEKLIPLIINNLRQGKELPVYGRGLNVRDWLYVDDHARAIDLALVKGQPGQVYNIGGLNEQENISIVRTIIETFAYITATTPRHDLIRYVSDRPGHDMRYAIDPSKAACHLGWAPAVSFAEGIGRTVRWYIENTPWMDSVTSGDYRQYYELMYNNR